MNIVPFSDISLLRGENFPICNINGKQYYIKNPKLKDIADLDVFENGLYHHYLTLLTTTIYDVADILWEESKVWYEDIGSDWDFFIMNCASSRRKIDVLLKFSDGNQTTELHQDAYAVNEKYRDALNFFFNTNGEYIFHVINGDSKNMCLLNVQKYDDDTYLYDSENGFKYTEHFMNITVQFLKKINCLRTEYEFLKGGSVYAKKTMFRYEYRARKKAARNKPSITLASIVSSLLAKGMSYYELWDYSIYLIYDQYYRHVRFEEWRTTISALHNGCINTKENPIQWEKINWSGVINF